MGVHVAWVEKSSEVFSRNFQTGFQWFYTMPNNFSALNMYALKIRENNQDYLSTHYKLCKEQCIKFIYSEKARTILKTFQLDLMLLSNTQISVEGFLQIFWPSQNIWTLSRITQTTGLLNLKYFLFENSYTCKAHHEEWII